MASALATPHTATRPSSLSSSFGLSSSLSFMFVLFFWFFFWLFWLVLLGFAFCSAFCSSSIFFQPDLLDWLERLDGLVGAINKAIHDATPCVYITVGAQRTAVTT